MGKLGRMGERLLFLSCSPACRAASAAGPRAPSIRSMGRSGPQRASPLAGEAGPCRPRAGGRIGGRAAAIVHGGAAASCMGRAGGRAARRPGGIMAMMMGV